MTISKFASTFLDKLDPQEELKWTLPFSPILADDEEIEDDFTIVVSPESALLGLKILGAGDGHADPVRSEANKSIDLWKGIDVANQDDPIFYGDGVLLSYEAFFSTNASNVRNRTFSVQVVHL